MTQSFTVKTRRVLLLSTTLSTLLLACGSQPPTAPGPTTENLASKHFTVYGTVYAVTPDGRQPLPGVGIERVIDLAGSGYIGRVATSDAAGHYSIPDVSYSSTIAVFTDRWAQPCPAFVASVTQDSVVDLEVMRSPIYPAPARSPRLSGVVYYRQPDGVRRPYREGSSIGFYSGTNVALQRINLVRGATDDDGRFELCGLPPGPAVLTVGYGWDFHSVETNLFIQNDAAVEIEVPFPYGAVAKHSHLRDALSTLALHRRPRAVTALLEGS